MIDFAAKLEGLFNFKMHPIAIAYERSRANNRLIIKGNQGGGTATAMHDAAQRVLGVHPDKEKNDLADKPIRFVSKVVPNDHNCEENQQFVEFRQLIPPEKWIKKLTARSKIGRVERMVGGTVDVEFMASTQDLDAFMSVQRAAYYQDEEIDRTKWDENQKRLIKARSDKHYADTTLSMTPVKGLDWSYDSLWKRARRIFRSKCICDKFGFPIVKHTIPGVVNKDGELIEMEMGIEDQNVKSDIEVFCWATDDNPVMDKEAIDSLFYEFDDEDEIAMARYGVFRQVSGRIYKVFDEKVHKKSFDKVFSADRFKNYWHFRIIDFHPSKPWDVSWVAVTPHHEWFVWNELEASHDRKTSHDLRDDIKDESLLDEDDEFNRTTLVDPLAQVKQNNTGLSVFDDISMGELGLRRCQSADTKNAQGRMNIKARLKNSVTCGVPGNNYFPNQPPDIRYGHYKPTIWFLDNCTGHIEHFRSWRYIDYKQAAVKAVRVVKRESEKWSDYCRNLEFLGALNPVYYEKVKDDNWHKSSLFQGRKRA
jgi:hypothetical protein